MKPKFTFFKGRYPEEWSLVPTIIVCFQKPRYIIIQFLKWYLEIDLFEKPLSKK